MGCLDARRHGPWDLPAGRDNGRSADGRRVPAAAPEGEAVPHSQSCPAKPDSVTRLPSSGSGVLVPGARRRGGAPDARPGRREAQGLVGQGVNWAGWSTGSGYEFG